MIFYVIYVLAPQYPTGDVSLCSDIEESGVLDRCYYDAVINTRSLDLCDKVHSKIFCRNRVYFGLALENLSSDICDNIDNSEGPYDSLFCKRQVSLHKDDFDFAIMSNSLNECNKLTGRYKWLTDKLREECKKNIAVP